LFILSQLRKKSFLLNPQNRYCRQNLYNAQFRRASFSLPSNVPENLSTVSKMSDRQAYRINRSIQATDQHRSALGVAKAPCFLSILTVSIIVALISLSSSPIVAQGIELDTPIVPAGVDLQSTGAGVASAVYDDMAYGLEPCDSCGGGGCGSCGSGCGVGFWIRADYMLWWEKDSFLPPLATTGANTSEIGAPGTEVLFGGGQVDDNPLDGYRFEVGAWLDPGANVGIMARYFSSGDRELGLSAGPNDFAVLGVPFSNLLTGAEDVFMLTVPGEREGSLGIGYSGDIKGWELLLRRCASTGCNYRIDYLIGYRNVTIDEGMNLSATTTVLAGSPVGIEGQTVAFNDSIRTENEFSGVDVGLTGQSSEGCWTLDFLAKIAFGEMRQRTDIQGGTVVNTPGLPTTTLIGGLFSQESNIGTFKSDEFAVIPELNVNVSYAMTPQLDVTFGYTVIYFTDVIHPGHAMDRVIDPGFLSDSPPTVGNRPAVGNDSREYWLQGLNFGLTGRF
jgi:hypothetical protein